jgi:polyphosphate kinase
VETKVLSRAGYEKELARLQVELVRLQEWIVQEGLKVVVLFEGRDTAGKGGVIRRIAERTNPRVVRTVALATPSDRERTQWYFQRYVAHMPAAGEMVLFDRSWYNRAGVERVMGFCTDAEYEEFMRTCPQFERILQGSGTVLLKYWLSVSDEEQERRFERRQKDPAKHWKLSPVDVESRARWVDYAEAKDEMFAYTDTKDSPWFVVEADDKRTARLNLISHLLDQIPYEPIDDEKIEFPTPPGARLRPSSSRYPDICPRALPSQVSKEAASLPAQPGTSPGAQPTIASIDEPPRGGAAR